MLRRGSMTFIGKSTFDKLLHIIGILRWGVGFIPHNAFSRIEKDDDLVETI
jgi:hypothetical protein